MLSQSSTSSMSMLFYADKTAHSIDIAVHSLTQVDRDNLKYAASAVKYGVSIGSAIGVGLGFALAFRIRSARRRLVTAIRTTDRPTHVRYADGREEAIPDFSAALAPSPVGDFFAYTLLGFGGLFLGGETGLLIGGYRAKGLVGSDPDSKQRIEDAWRKFRADVLRTQANILDQAAKEGRPLGAIPEEKWF